MKKIISLILALTIVAAAFTACGSDSKKSEKKKEDTSHTLYFKDGLKNKKAVATFFNSDSGKSQDVKMKKIGEDKNFVTFSCKGDTAKYNMAYVTRGKEKSREFAFNKCTSGWYQTTDDFMPYVQGEGIKYMPTFDVVTLKGYGYEKKVHIWTPEGYSAKSSEKYSTIYVLDGQAVAYGGQEDSDIVHSAGFIEQVRAMKAVTGKKAIVVVIENVFARDYELVPDIGLSFDEKMHGEVKYDSMDGSQFADFVANTLAPYVRKHYNVYSDAIHTAIAGYSLGGLEAFYMGMEYPETFGTVGALSPSFWEYDAKTWTKYLKGKTFGGKSPFVYMYSGSLKADVPKVRGMYNRLKKLGYPDDKLVYHYDENGAHDLSYWCAVFSEILEGMMYRRIEPLMS